MLWTPSLLLVQNWVSKELETISQILICEEGSPGFKYRITVMRRMDFCYEIPERKSVNTD